MYIDDGSELDEETFLYFAATNYYNPKCNTLEDFYEDVARFRFLKKQVKRYLQTKKINIRLFVNHLILLSNCFTIPSTLKMLEYKLDETEWAVVRPGLLNLNYITSKDYTHIQNDNYIEKLLENIYDN